MAIEFDCPYCTAPIRVPDAAAGKRGTCPRCKTGILVPKVKTGPKLKGKAKESQPAPEPEPAPQEPAKKSKKQSVRDRFADEPDFTNFDAAESSPPAATATQPAPPPTASRPTPPPTPADAAPVVTPISQQLKRRKRRRYAWVPILFGAILVGGVCIFFMFNKSKKLEGDLEATVVGNETLKQRLIRTSEIDVEPENVKQVLQQLDERPFKFSRFSYVASDAGITVRPFASETNDVIEVNIGNRKNLLEYFKEHADELDAYRRRTYETGLRTFFIDAANALDDEARISEALGSDLQSKVFANAFIDVHGYHLVASLNGNGYHCIYQDGNRLYYLLPKGTKTFRLRGRKLPDDSQRVRVNYFVQVVEAESSAAVKTTEVEDKTKTDEPD